MVNGPAVFKVDCFVFLILQDGVNNSISTTEEKVIEKKQRKPVSLAVTSPIDDFRPSDGDDEFRVSQRRKIKSSSLRHQVPAVRYILIFHYKLVLIFQMLYPNVSSSFKIVLKEVLFLLIDFSSNLLFISNAQIWVKI